MKTPSALADYLNLIEKTLPTDNLISQKQNADSIKNYYQANHLPYLLFHNKEGFIHMGITKNGKFKTEDLLWQLKLINGYIHQLKAQNVLEIGSGNGANSAYLAKLNKLVTFKALELSKKPLKRFKIKNFSQELGDYHDLSRFPDRSFDLCFAIETICHSPEKEKVFQQVHKKLKKDGLLIIFDGYLAKPLTSLNEREKFAQQLMTKSMAVDSFELLKDVEQKMTKSGFKIAKQTNLSQFILPTMEKHIRLALLFYRHSRVRHLIPSKISQNAIAGLLLPELVKSKIDCYYLHVLKKVS